MKVAESCGVTVTSTESGREVQPAAAAVAKYQPEAGGRALANWGFWSGEVKLFGPLQE